MRLNITKPFSIIIKSRLGTLNACFGVQIIMVRNQSGLGNHNGNQQPEPRIIERAPEIVPIVEPVIMAGVQAMIQDMLAEYREEIK